MLRGRLEEVGVTSAKARLFSARQVAPISEASRPRGSDLGSAAASDTRLTCRTSRRQRLFSSKETFDATSSACRPSDAAGLRRLKYTADRPVSFCPLAPRK